MRTFSLLAIILVLTSCINSNTESQNDLIDQADTTNVAAWSVDSIDIWVNTVFLESINDNISICDCWRNSKYQLLYYDTLHMELYIKSNLMHFGHDSEIIVPIIQTDSSYRYDSTLNDWPLEVKEFKIPINDTLTLSDGDKNYRFIKQSLIIEKDSNSMKNNYLLYSEFRDIFYQLSSNLLLKYSVFDRERSTSLIIEPDTLRNLIQSGLVRGHCSDDFYFDGITIEGNRNRYFQLQFKNNELWMYEHEGRDRRQKLNLDTLPKQIMFLKD